MTRPSSERGVALVAALLVMTMMSAMLAGFMVMVNADQSAGGIERDQTQAYAAAHAGVEKLTADLGQLFAGNFSPTGAQLNALGAAAMEPDLPGIEFVRPDGGSGYRILFEDTNPADGNPDVANPGGTPISAGPYQGLMGLITPYTIEVTSRTAGDAEVRMRRTMQTIAIPVFQFGVFSENDLSFHSNDFAFGGRVHTNANLYLAAVGSTTTTLADRVTAVQEVIRTHFTNGRTTSGASYTGNIRMAKAPGCPAAPTAINNTLCRNLAMNEGSLTGNVGSSANPNWVNLSVGTYNSYIRTGLTGARRLDLPLVSDGAEPIDIIRRPPDLPTIEPAGLAEQRFYNLATLRILLSDTAADITSLPDTVGTPVSLEDAATPATAGNYPLAQSTGSANDGYRSANNTPLIGGHILINRQAANGTWSDVTHEILALGISGRNLGTGSLSSTSLGTCSTTNAAHQHVNAVIRLQRLKDNAAASPNHCNLQSGRHYYWPNTLYDPREGLRRDNASTSGVNLYLGGVMHYIEFDVDNFRRWINGDIGTSGPGSMNVTGYVVYFSDRRTNRNAANEETGEFGWEDTINTNVNGDPNNVLNAGEDVNGSGGLPETYGNVPRITYTVTAPSGGGTWGSGSAINGATTVSSLVNMGVARSNRAVFFRRALKLVDGGLGTLPSNGLQGLTIASENPVYVEGNFNACGNAITGNCASGGFGPTGDAHRSAAIIADAVTLLSRNWNDKRSFTGPHDPADRPAQTTWYRMAVISGKGIAFPHPNNGEFANFGSDGGAHNFMRFIEDWGSATVNYRGSMVSLYTSRQGTGSWKCCVNVYSPPARGTTFDVEFLQPNLLPPRTPMFRDINTLTFRQIMRPTQ